VPKFGAGTAAERRRKSPQEYGHFPGWSTTRARQVCVCPWLYQPRHTTGWSKGRGATGSLPRPLGPRPSPACSLASSLPGG